MVTVKKYVLGFAETRGYALFGCCLAPTAIDGLKSY